MSNALITKLEIDLGFKMLAWKVPKSWKFTNITKLTCRWSKPQHFEL